MCVATGRVSWKSVVVGPKPEATQSASSVGSSAQVCVCLCVCCLRTTKESNSSGAFSAIQPKISFVSLQQHTYSIHYTTYRLSNTILYTVKVNTYTHKKEQSQEEEKSLDEIENQALTAWLTRFVQKVSEFLLYLFFSCFSFIIFLHL